MFSPARRAARTAALLLLAGLLIASARPSSLVTAQELMTPTPGALARPDSCELNDTPERACVLPLDSVSGPFTLLPAGDRDVYAIDLGAEPTGLALAVTIRSTDGLDLLVTIRRAGETTPLAILSSPALTTTLDAGLAGWLTLGVENRSPAPPEGQGYTIELRRVLPPPAPAPDARNPQDAAEPDRLENNWSVATAAQVGVGAVYDLTFACPVAGGCVGGDHDYLAASVKAGLRYRIATFDLGPGVDTALDLFWDGALVAANDDARPGASFLSALDWTTPGNGVLIIRVAPRTGGQGPVVFEPKGGSYRFAIALAESDLGSQLARRIAEQTGQATSAPAAAGGAPTSPSATPASDAPTGAAEVVANSTALRDAPSADAATLETLPSGAAVTLLGQASGGWVRVQPQDGVVPGWVRGGDLRRSAAAPASVGAPTAQPTSNALAPPSAQPALTLPTATPAPKLRITALEAAPPPPPASARANQTVTVAVQLRAVRAPPEASPGRPAPTPAAGTWRPLAGRRVQLVTVFGDVLAEAVSDESGQVTITRDIPPGDAILIRVPELGVQAPVSPSQPIDIVIAEDL